MFTRCPNEDCKTAFRVTEHAMQQAMGTIRCVKCRTVFNALSTLEELRPQGLVIPISSQLPFQQFGDRIVIDPRMLANAAWFKEQDAAPAAERREGAVDEDLPEAAFDDTQDAASTRRMKRIDRLAAEVGVRPFSKFAGTGEATPKRSALFMVLAEAFHDFQLASRNLLRQRRRTAMGLFAISFGVTALMLAGGFIEWNNWALRESTIESHLGHIQIVRKGYFEKGESDPFDFLLPEQSPVLEAVSNMSEVEAVAPRLEFSGLISFGETTVSFLGEGVAPDKEEKVSRWVKIVKGDPLTTAKPNGVIVGKGLADNLRIETGSTVVLMATGASGGLGAVEGQVVGIFQTTNKAFDDAALRVPIGMARQLMRVEGAHRWVVLLKSTDQTDPTLARLKKKFPNEQSLEFVPWLNLADFYKKVVVLFSAQMNLIRFIIALIIVVSISNTLIMNVMERTSEIGTLMALGRKRSMILRLFLEEGVLLGIFGGVTGAALGWGLARIISHIGIPMPPSPGMDFSFKGEIMATWPLAIGGIFLGLVSTVLASLYPARRASRLEIVDALRHSR